jgi:outer membrane protein OmpA-like peptidoglycan-associated protein
MKKFNLLLIVFLSFTLVINAQEQEITKKEPKTVLGKGIRELDKAFSEVEDFFKNLFKKRIRIPYKLGTNKHETKIKKHKIPDNYIKIKPIVTTTRDSFFDFEIEKNLRPELELKVMYPRITFKKGYVSFQMGDYKYSRYLKDIRPEDIEYIKLISPASDTTPSDTCIVKKFRIINKKEIKRHFSFLLDHSGSMGDARASKLQTGVYNAIKTDISKNNTGNTTYTIHKFDGEGNHQHLATSKDLNNIKKVLDPPIGLRGFGYSTAILDALLQGIDVLSKDDQSESKIMILFTDGFSNTDRTFLNPSDVIRKAIDNKINVVVVGFGSNIHEYSLNSMASFAGGNFYRIYHENEFDQLYDNILTDAGLSYDLEFSPCMFGDEIEIEIKVNGIDESVIGSTFFRTPADQGYSIAVDILYDKGLYAIDEERFEDELNQIVQLMNYKKNIKILIEGHTDKTGTQQANDWLSSKRAESLKNYLIKMGIAEHRMESKGYGWDKPAYPYDGNKKENALNRRIEIIIH